MTPEKYMAYVESLSPIQRLAEDMQTADENVVVLWIKQALTWAQAAEVAQPHDAKLAREVLDSLSNIQVRPFYTPEELSLMFPSITGVLRANRRIDSTTSGEVSRQLRDAGIRYLECADNPKGFRWRGMMQQFLVVAPKETRWRQSITQEQFEQFMRAFPKYVDL